VNNPVRWTDHSGNSPDGMSASDATRIGGGESSAGEFRADSQMVDDSWARGMAQQNAGRSYEENASEVPFTQVMREQTQARAMQAQRDVIAGFQTLGTGNKYVGNWTKFMYAAGKGFGNGFISLPGNFIDGVKGAVKLNYDLLTDFSGTVNRAKERVTDIAVKAVEIASDPHGTYEKVMDQMTAMGEDGLLSAAGEITGGIAFDVWSGGLTKGMGGKAMAMAQETKVGRAIAKGYEEARGAVQSAKTALASKLPSVNTLTRAIAANEVAIVSSLDNIETRTVYRELPSGAKRIIQALERKGSAYVGNGIHLDDLVAASKWFEKEVAVVQHKTTGTLKAVLGNMEQVKTSSEFDFVAHTHPVFNTKPSHLTLDIQNASDRVEIVIDWQKNITHFNKYGIINNPTESPINSLNYIVGYKVKRYE
jgi:hypothetical protein